MSFLQTAINPALELLGPKYTSDEARVMLLAIGYQESRFEHRRQIGGPARGFFQFESGGGLRGVMEHASTEHAARRVATSLVYPFKRDVLFDAIIHNDVLAAAFARLLLWTDPRPLPAMGDTSASWEFYLRNWRPGKPHKSTWAQCYAWALEDMAA